MEYGIRLMIKMTMATGSTWEFRAKAGIMGNQGNSMLTMVIQFHADLKDNEAVLILPQHRLCDFSYTVSLNNSKDFDIITEKCQLPADVQLSGRQTYKGTVFQWPNQGNPATHLVLATSPKNTASGENDTASN